MNLPDFDELPYLPGLDVRHAWDVFGRGDVLGSINLVTPDRVAAAAAEVIAGDMFSLDLPLNEPNPPLFGRRAYQHHVVALNRNEMDDHVDDFHLQGSTQWDALNHVRCREHGYWGGRTMDPTPGYNGLGIEHWAEHGIAGRGLLVDVAGWMETHAPGYHPMARCPISVAELDATVADQRLEPRPGDIWCVRTGWAKAYRELSPDERVRYADEPTFAGLRASEDVARYLWDRHPAALCADNPAVEAVPILPAEGSLHRRLLPSLGLALGEMFDFEALTAVCRVDDRWTFMFVAAPLRLPGGLGSPGNAVAIR